MRALRTFRDLVRWVRADAVSRGVPNIARGVVFDPVFRFTVYLRFNEWLVNRGSSLAVRAVPTLVFRRLSVRLGFSVPPNVFGPGLAIVHYGTLIVSPDTRVGKNCRIHADVNIGGAVGFMDPAAAALAAPVIGDDCYIGPGAKIYGAIRIGNSCVIGANSVVNKSFDNDCVTIAGVPAKIIKHAGSDGMLFRGAS
jgi:serine O-acetyltransferase